MHKPITRRIRSIVDGSHVHRHGACDFESRHRTLSFFLLLFLDFRFLLINLFIFRYNSYSFFKLFWLLNIALMTPNDAYSIESMHSVASRICVFMFDDVPFYGHFV